jgi:hypothetical protein
MCALSKQVAESLEASAFCAVPSMMQRHHHQHTHCMLHAVAEEGADGIMEAKPILQSRNHRKSVMILSKLLTLLVGPLQNVWENKTSNR